uniref:Uncharacterized protein n=1 Tax=Lygus hesperus TaxID=30085 RepID=A0A146LB97_LYGHE
MSTKTITKVTTSNDNDVFFSALNGFSHDMQREGDNLQSCIDDLFILADAMKPVVQADPQELPALTVNLYSTLTRQLQDYYSEMSLCLQRYRTDIEAGKVHI